ncbi:MAG: GspH/FimT family pseudopilin [Sphingomonadaceae bacterium]
MPTSATGNSRIATPNGFTLVELLVVLVVIGLASAAVMLTLPDDRGGLRVEAERLAARVHAARDEAIVQARPVALIIDSSGYGFERYRRGEWRPITEPPFDRREWPENMLVRIEGTSDGRVAFDEMGISDGAIVTLNRGEDRVRIGIGSDGKIDADI